MYKCYCCGATFDTPWAKLPRYVSRYSEEYGDRAIMCCPVCGEENYMECWGEEDDDDEADHPGVSPAHKLHAK